MTPSSPGPIPRARSGTRVCGHDVGRERPSERQRSADVHAGRLLQPRNQRVVDADRVVGLGPDRASLHAAILPRPRRFGRAVEVEQQGRRLQHHRLGRLHHRVIRHGAISPSATTWIVGADLGWNPVTNLNFDLELMYQSTNQSAPSGFLGTIYNWGQIERSSSCRATGMGSATVSRAAFASPATSDRVTIS